MWEYIKEAFSAYPAYSIICLLITISSFVFCGGLDSKKNPPSPSKPENHYDPSVIYKEKYTDLLAQHSGLQGKYDSLKKKLDEAKRDNLRYQKELNEQRSEIDRLMATQKATASMAQDDYLHDDIHEQLKEIADKNDELAQRIIQIQDRESSVSERELKAERDLKHADELEELFSSSLFGLFHTTPRSLFADSMVCKELLSEKDNAVFIAKRFNEQKLSELQDMWDFKAAVQMKSARGNDVFEVTLDSCTCKDFNVNLKRQHPCKHMYKLAITIGYLASFDQSQLYSQLKQINNNEGW